VGGARALRGRWLVLVWLGGRSAPERKFYS